MLRRMCGLCPDCAQWVPELAEGVLEEHDDGYDEVCTPALYADVVLRPDLLHLPVITIDLPDSPAGAVMAG